MRRVISLVNHPAASVSILCLSSLSFVHLFLSFSRVFQRYLNDQLSAIISSRPGGLGLIVSGFLSRGKSAIKEFSAAGDTAGRGGRNKIYRPADRPWRCLVLLRNRPRDLSRGSCSKYLNEIFRNSILYHSVYLLFSRNFYKVDFTSFSN